MISADGSLKRQRCAIYTRVSTTTGLDQEFNSLDNQREAAEAFIKSQVHEGWAILPDRFDDGGYSGGTLERPAVQCLLEKVRAGVIDVIVVYKIDRLTRSLSDFARLVDIFDGHGVSFVSVTQQFNTTTSMGRLTLNVLLSFAQFEREVTAERIRDKIAATKRKGKRSGGPVPLGYEVRDKQLIVNEEEADRVRLIFRRYLELGSLNALVADLDRTGVRTRKTQLKDGRIRGGIAFTKGPLAYLLRNRVYIGDIIHKARHFPGEHRPIVDRSLFDAVQDRMVRQAQARRVQRIRTQALLAGRLFDDCGNRMVTSTSRKGAARYRYYVSAPLMRGCREEAGCVSRVPAPEIETAVVEAVRQRLGSFGGSFNDGEGRVSAASSSLGSDNQGSIAGDNNGGDNQELVTRHVARVEVHSGHLAIDLVGLVNSDGEEHLETVVHPCSPMPNRRRRQVMLPVETENSSSGTPIRAETRARLIEGIAKALQWRDELLSGTVTDTREIAAREKLSDRSVRMTLNLAFLSPDIVRAAIDGTLPDGYGVTVLAGAPLCWSEQVQLLGR